jgi:hypothetical protein
MNSAFRAYVHDPVVHAMQATCEEMPEQSERKHHIASDRKAENNRKHSPRESTK